MLCTPCSISTAVVLLFQVATLLNSFQMFPEEVCLRGEIPPLFHMWKFFWYLFSLPTHFKSLTWILSAAELVTA